MKVAQIERKELVLMELEEGVDFNQEDLEGDNYAPALKTINHSKLEKIAYKLGFLGVDWRGHYNPEKKTIEVRLYKHLYI